MSASPSPMTGPAFDRVVAALERVSGPVRATGDRAMARCPAHDDSTASLSLRRAAGGVLVKCHAGCETEAVVERLGLRMSDLYDEPRREGQSSGSRLLESYAYVDESGAELYQVVRYSPKGFKQRRRDPRTGEWIWNLTGVRRVLYRLPAVLAAVKSGATVWIAEGEKDVHALERAGVVATTNPGGAGKWRKDYGEALAGADVVIILDADRTGEEHALNILRDLGPRGGTVRLVRAAEGKDAYDHLAAGHTIAEFVPVATADLKETVAVRKRAEAETVKVARQPRLVVLEGRSNADSGFACTDLGNAERLAALHGEDLRYVALWDSWLAWDGKRWRRDDVLEVQRRAELTARSIYAEAADQTTPEARHTALSAHAVRSEGAARIAAMTTLARSDLTIALRPDHLDADLYAFNVLNGTLDLRTGELREHRRDDLITKLAPVEYIADARSELWERFLYETFGADGDLIRFVQRAAGYSLTGDTAEEKFMVGIGVPATGKSTFIDALVGVMGDYAIFSNMETFLDQQRGNGAGGPRSDIARLRGARLVAAIEAQQGRRFDETLVNTITGRDKINTRDLHEKQSSFEARFKLWILANHAPRVVDDDSGLWRRILRIPFGHRVPEDRRDRTLKTELTNLHETGAAILAWMVNGCLSWQREGLNAPEVVKTTTAEYREEMDVLGDFLDECCVLEKDARVSSASLYTAYRAWAVESGIRFPLTKKSLGERLEARGYLAVAGAHHARYRQGLMLVGQPQQQGAFADDDLPV